MTTSSSQEKDANDHDHFRGNSVVIIAFDIGSSSLRCTAYTATPDLNVLCHASVKRVTVCNDSSGKIVIDGLLDRLDELFFTVIDQLIIRYEQQQQQFKVKAIGFSTLVMNLVGVNADGEPVGDHATLSYACNSPQVARQVQEIKELLGGEENCLQLYQRTGTPVHSAYALAQLRAIYHDKSSAKQQVLADEIVSWQTISSLCISRWIHGGSMAATTTKAMPISFSEASWTGLMNIRTCQYEETILEKLLPPQCTKALPTIHDYNETVYSIPPSSPYWRPCLQEARLYLGVGDGACANIGSKCVTSDRIACTVGTSAAARVVVDAAVSDDDISQPQPLSSTINVPPGLFCYRIDRNHLLLGGALTDGGSAIEWMAQLLGLKAEKDLEDCLAHVTELYENEEMGSTHLSLVPFLSGERSTGFRSGATGAMLGLTRETTPAHLMKACIEGVTLRLHTVVQLILRQREKQIPPPQILVSGKALEVNTLWRQMLADCIGLPIIIDTTTQEGTSRGVASLLLASLNGSWPDNEGISTTIVSEPNIDRKAYWQTLQRHQEDLIEALSPLYGKV